MSVPTVFLCELLFTSRDRTLWLWMALIVCLASVSIGFGLAEVNRQHVTLQKLTVADQQDRLAASQKFTDWGGAAYYSFHLTFDSPSDFAFAAMGQRDEQSWKHRIRMLALEGQIYERDAGNPSVALIGRFDFSFFAAFIFPLILIMLLYDVRASELTAGRYNLLEATVGQSNVLWTSRTGIRAGAAFLCLLIPLLFAGLFAGTSFKTLVLATLALFAFTLFWTTLCYVLSAWRKSSSVTLMSLLAIWLFTTVILPAGGKLMVDRLIPLPSGADILMLQRETVNDAWDLPREVTMDVFFERHPEWSDYKQIKGPFEWPWYYAFQQVGDQTTEALTTAYKDGRLKRDNLAAWVSLLAPSSLLERSLQSLAHTDLSASIHYENRVRAYHAKLRAFYYPKLFRNEPFDMSALDHIPRYFQHPTAR